MEYTITIPDKLVPGLNKIVGRYNAEQGTDLSVAGWLQLHALEIAVGDQLAAEQQRLARQAEADVQAAVVALRDRLTAADSEVNS
jgi:hypothetical protein